MKTSTVNTVSRRAVLASPLALVTLKAKASAADADADADYPSRPIKVVVPFAAGGPADVIARIICERVQGSLGQALVIDNRPGAGGIVGAQAVAAAAPDGYTLLIGTIHHAVLPSLQPKLPYDLRQDFIALTKATSVPIIVCVHPSLPCRTVPELIAYAKRNAEKTAFGSSGNGGATHLAAELFNHHLGTRMLHVPYSGSAPAMADLIGGQIQVMFADAQSAIHQVTAGKVRALAVCSAQRSKLFPELPTLVEVTGNARLTTDTWSGVLVRTGVPSAIAQRLETEFRQALADPKVAEKQDIRLTSAAGNTVINRN